MNRSRNSSASGSGDNVVYLFSKASAVPVSEGRQTIHPPEDPSMYDAFWTEQERAYTKGVDADSLQAMNQVYNGEAQPHIILHEDGVNEKMDEWEKKYIEHLDREMSDIRRESSDALREIRNIVQASEDRNEQRMERIESKIDSTREALEKKIENSITENKAAAKEQRFWSVATFIAVAGLVIATVIGIVQIVVAMK